VLPERAPSEEPRSTGAVGQSQAASLQEWWSGICRAYGQHVLVEREIRDESSIGYVSSNCRSCHSSSCPGGRTSSYFMSSPASSASASSRKNS
jgi:hypothetical protein